MGAAKAMALGSLVRRWSQAAAFAAGVGLAVAAYVTLVVSVGVVAGSGGGGVWPSGRWPSLAAMVVVALVLQPLWRRTVRLVDRIAYGARPAPPEVLTDFSRRLGRGSTSDSLLPTVAEATATALSAGQVTVRMSAPDGRVQAVRWPSEPVECRAARVVEVDVVDSDEGLGSISVGLPSGRALRSRDRAVLSDLARQTAVAVRTERLAAQVARGASLLDRQAELLEQFRQRIISARDAERDRLERAIRDGVVPYLAPAPHRLRQAASQVPDAWAERHVSMVLTDTADALESLRWICRGLRPPPFVRPGLRKLP